MSHDIYEAIYKAASVLEVPVIILALLSLALVIFESGAFAIELYAHRNRRFVALTMASESARTAIDKGDRTTAAKDLQALAWSPAIATALDAFVASAGTPGADTRMAKELADFDFGRQKRLGRTRLLVRTGPALGLMGTLIPLSPALDGLARGNVAALTQNLRTAFSITVLGLLIGAIAFGLSLSRDRMYGQDLSDLEYVAAILTADENPTAVTQSPLTVHVPDPATERSKDALKDPVTEPVKVAEPGR